MTWNNSNKEWYEGFGYKGYVWGKAFTVRCEELIHTSKIKVKVKCDYCGNEFETQYSTYLQGHKKLGKDCCIKCRSIKRSEMTRVKRSQEAWKKLTSFCDSKGYTLITSIDEYTGVKMKVEYICPKHGKKIGMLDNMVRGHGCVDCKNEEMTYIMHHDINYIEDYINSFNDNILLNKEEYKDVFTRNLRIKCKCGNIYTTSFANYEKHDVRQCFSCSSKQSKNESYITSILLGMKINFIPEKRFRDCRDKKPLPFDFYLPEYNLIIEYDGEGRYLESFYDGKCDNPHEELLNRKRKDDIKNKYCEDHKIHILRIPYWEQENIESIITNKINSLKIIKNVV